MSSVGLAPLLGCWPRWLGGWGFAGWVCVGSGGDAHFEGAEQFDFEADGVVGLEPASEVVAVGHGMFEEASAWDGAGSKDVAGLDVSPS